jgi:hypothetical protein
MQATEVTVSPKARARNLAKTPRHASQRLVVEIDASSDALIDLMTEQCAEGGYITAYAGSQQELRQAGVPVEAFPETDEKRVFQVSTINVCCTGRREMLKGSMTKRGAVYELEIDWGFIRPYLQGSHPALQELARMLLKDILAWTDGESMEAPLIRLAADRRATGFKPNLDQKSYRLTPEFHKRLKESYRSVYDLVFTHGEIIVKNNELSTQKPKQSHLTLVA